MDGPADVIPLQYFSDLPDPRAANVRHRLIDLLVMALCATICGADGWDDFEDFADAKADWFSTFLDLQHGIPSADTFRRVISRLDPVEFERCFLQWMQSVVELSQGKLVAIDGKSIRRSFERGCDKIGMAHISIERRYFIISLPADAKAMAAAIRGHWSIENGLHHVLDVSFREDDSRIRKDHGAENVSRLRRMSMNLLRVQGDKHTKRQSIKGRRKIAAWNQDFLLHLIAG